MKRTSPLACLHKTPGGTSAARLLVLLAAFLSALLSCSAASRARAEESRTYALGYPDGTRVRCEFRGRRPGAVTLRYRTPRAAGWRSQRVAMPAGWRIPSRADVAGLPVVLAGPTSRTGAGQVRGQVSLVVVVQSDESALWEYRKPVVLSLGPNGFRALTTTADTGPAAAGDPAFSNLGGFRVQGSRVLVWDIAYDERFARFAPQKYRLRAFECRGNGLRRVQDRTTRKRYPVFGLAYLQDAATRPKVDPLRELGQRWEWWGSATPPQGQPGQQ
jgi:hypothetical protein